MIYMFIAIQYCQLMYLRTFETCLQIYELGPEKYFSAPGLAWQAALKKPEVNMSLMVKKV